MSKINEAIIRDPDTVLLLMKATVSFCSAYPNEPIVRNPLVSVNSIISMLTHYPEHHPDSGISSVSFETALAIINSLTRQGYLKEVYKIDTSCGDCGVVNRAIQKLTNTEGLDRVSAICNLTLIHYFVRHSDSEHAVLGYSFDELSKLTSISTDTIQKWADEMCGLRTGIYVDRANGKYLIYKSKLPKFMLKDINKSYKEVQFVIEAFPEVRDE